MKQLLHLGSYPYPLPSSAPVFSGLESAVTRAASLYRITSVFPFFSGGPLEKIPMATSVLVGLMTHVLPNVSPLFFWFLSFFPKSPLFPLVLHRFDHFLF